MTYETPVGANMFAYCLNNPAMYSDDGGETPVAIGAGIGAVLGGFSAYMSGDSILLGAATGAASGAAITFLGGGVIMSMCIAGASNIVNQSVNHYIDNSKGKNQSFYDTMGSFELNTTSLAIDTMAAGVFAGLGNSTGNVIDSAFKNLSSRQDGLIKAVFTHCYEGINSLFEFGSTEVAHAIFER